MSDIELRVLLVLPNLYIGGSQEAVRMLAKHLASDHCMPVVCSLFDGGPLLEELSADKIQVEVLHLPRRHFLAFPWYVADMVRLWRSLSRIVAKYGINVIQTYILGSQHFLVLALARIRGIPLFILNFRNEKFLPFSHAGSLKNQIHRVAYRLARRWASDFVAVSAEVKQAILDTLGLPEEDVTVICNGVDVDRYRQPIDRCGVRRQWGLDAESRLLITVGTLKTQKGHCHLIEAATEITRLHPEAHLLFVGDGKLKLQLQAQSDACGLSDKIHFLGNRRDVSELLAASDIFVLPSLWEGLSMALLEAMAAAKPIVATAVSGTSQVMIHNETGILVPPANAVELAQAIDKLLSDPARASVMGEAARQRVEAHFSAKKQAAEYLALYRRLLQEG
jgi:glycosyltransferase involved in cell wall biosynthesis